MNVEIQLNGTNISSYVERYSREQKICTGVGTLDLVLTGNYPGELITWDTITIYEESSLAGTYSISEISYNKPEHEILISAQDDSKRLQDYFISDEYTIDYASNNLYWIEKFLAEAGVTYSVLEGTKSVLLQNDTTIGPVQAYEEIVQLLQMGGLFMYFDATNTCIIGTLSKDLSSPEFSFTNEDILSIKTNINDKMLRNRVVVWGKADATATNWIFADVTRITPWNYDSTDKRTAVASSAYIANMGTAYAFANKMLDEFARITFTKDIIIYGSRGVTIGDLVFLSSVPFTGVGMATTIGVDMSKDGLLTHIILDERCPRIFGYFGYRDYVYVGMNGQGVWRKKVEEATWEDYSAGLTDPTVIDLYKNNGIMSCVTENGLLFRGSDSSNAWSIVPIPSLQLDTLEPASGIMVRAVTQDRRTNQIHAVVDNREGKNRRDYGTTLSGIMDANANALKDACWVVEFNPYNGATQGIHPVTVSGFYGFEGFDIDNDGKNDYVSVRAVGSGNTLVGSIVGFTNSPYWSVGDAVAVGGIPDDFVPVDCGVVSAQPMVAWISSTFNYGVDIGTAWIDVENKVLHATYLTLDGKTIEDTLSMNVPGSSSFYIVGMKQINKYDYRVLTGYDSTWKFYTLHLMENSYTEGATLTVPNKYDYYVNTKSTYFHPETRSGDKILGIHKEASQYGSGANYYGGVFYLVGYTADFGTGTFSGPNVMCDIGHLQHVVGGYTYDSVALTGDYKVYHHGDNGFLVRALVIYPYLTGNIPRVGWWYLDELKLMKYEWSGFTLDDKSTSGVVIEDIVYTPHIHVETFAYYPSYYSPRSGYVEITETDGTMSPKTSFFYFTHYKGWYHGTIPNVDYTINSFSTYPENGGSETGYSITPNSSAKPLSEPGSVTVFRGYELSGSSLYSVDYASHDSVKFEAEGYDIKTVFNRIDTFLYNVLCWGKRISDGKFGIIAFNLIHQFTLFVPLLDSYSYEGYGGWALIANGFITIPYTSSTWKTFYIDGVSGGALYMVLKRAGNIFTPVYSGMYNYFRLDISEGNPVVAIPSGEWGMGFIDTATYQSYPVVSVDTEFINDFRYTHVSTPSGVRKEFYYSKGVNLLEKDLSEDLSTMVETGIVVDGIHMNGVIATPTSSGVMGKIETSNHQLPNQYVFISTEPASGMAGYSRFYQSDPTSGLAFVEYNYELPSGLINIIRLDDRM